MKLQPGYKQTEVGVIPEDWETDTVDHLANITTGAKNTQDRVEDGIYPFFVRSSVVESINSYSYDGEAVLTAGDGVGTGKVFHYVVGRFDCHQRVYRLSDFSADILGYYFYLYFSTFFYDRIMAMTAKSSVDSVRREMIANMVIPLPPLPEQRAIAAALGDVDALLAALDALLAKQRALKQAAMQQLLTGRTRLPGFTGAWVSRPLSILLKYEQPYRYIFDRLGLESVGAVPVLTANKTFILGFTNDTNGVCKSLPVIIFDDFTTASRFVTFPFKVRSSAMKLLFTQDKSDNLRFIFEQMQMATFQPGEHKRYYISEYQHLTIEIPSPAEQNAIIAVLSDIDAEIAALEAQIAKTRLLKQGMMQELLTGRIRLL